MKKEDLQKARELEDKIKFVKNHIRAAENLVNAKMEDVIKARVRGQNYELPKHIFKAEAQKRATALKKELKQLEKEFSNL